MCRTPKWGSPFSPSRVDHRCPELCDSRSRLGKRVCNQPDSRYIVSGKPYISTNRATMNEANAPKVRQSRAVAGLKKLKANRMNIAELRITSDHKPYAVSP